MLLQTQFISQGLAQYSACAFEVTASRSIAAVNNIVVLCVVVCECGRLTLQDVNRPCSSSLSAAATALLSSSHGDRLLGAALSQMSYKSPICVRVYVCGGVFSVVIILVILSAPRHITVSG